MPRSQYFEEMLRDLLDEERELNPAQLAELSDLDTDQLGTFESAWPSTPLPRRERIAQLLGELAQDNLEFLFDRVNRVLLEDPSPSVRRLAIQNLWENEEASLAKQLVQLASLDQEEAVRQEAVRALGRFVYLGEVNKIRPEAHAAVEAALLAILEGSDHPVELKRIALESMGYSSRPELPRHVRRSFESGEEAGVRSSLIAMGRSADTDWIPQVMERLHDPAPAVRAAAARAAGELEARKAAAILIELLDDASPVVNEAAIWALGQIGGDQARNALLRLQEQPGTNQLTRVIDEALDHIAFLEGTPDLMLFDFDVDE
jgi:HEAT repeat protein